MRRVVWLASVGAMVGGCPPWIPPGQHFEDDAVAVVGLVHDRLDGGRSDCDPDEAGATAYLLGQWGVSDGRVAGTEQIALFANAAWRAAGGADCWHTFDSAGEADGSVDGAGLNLNLDLIWDEDRSTCALDAFWVADAYVRAWRVVRSDAFDADTHVLRAADGTRVGTAWHTDAGMLEYATDGLCVSVWTDDTDQAALGGR